VVALGGERRERDQERHHDAARGVVASDVSECCGEGDGEHLHRPAPPRDERDGRDDGQRVAERVEIAELRLAFAVRGRVADGEHAHGRRQADIGRPARQRGVPTPGEPRSHGQNIRPRAGAVIPAAAELGAGGGSRCLTCDEHFPESGDDSGSC